MRIKKNLLKHEISNIIIIENLQIINFSYNKLKIAQQNENLPRFEVILKFHLSN